MITTTLENPLLQNRNLPKFDSINLDTFENDITQILTTFNNEVNDFEKDLNKEISYDSTIERVEEIYYPLNYAWSIINHLNGVSNSKELRDIYSKLQPKFIKMHDKINQSKIFFDALKKLQKSENNPMKKRIIDKTINSLILNGVNLNEADKTVYNENTLKLSELSNTFANNIIDYISNFKLVIKNKDDIEGLPENMKEIASRKAKKDLNCDANTEFGPWILTLDPPSYVCAMKNLKSSNIREKLYKNYITICKNENINIISEILEIRLEQAKLLGHSSHLDVSLSTKMASITEIESLINNISEKAKVKAIKELKEIKEFASLNQNSTFNHWDIPYYSEKLRKYKYNYSDEELKQYFYLPNVLKGLFDLANRLFDITIKKSNAEVWHEDVEFFEIFENNKIIASFFLDIYSRSENKQNGAWMADCIGKSKMLKNFIPSAYIITNIQKPIDNSPTLLTFNELNTLFHEFGHMLQHCLTLVEDGNVSGINNIEWDAIETPSQFMENWCYDKKTLYSFAKHYLTNEPLPEELFVKLIESKKYNKGIEICQQIAYGMVDINIHTKLSNIKYENRETLFDFQNNILKKYLPISPNENNCFICNFAHIFAGGYSCGYYSYIWSEVLSADIFNVFENNMNDEKKIKILGKKFRETILGQGGSKHPLQIFKDFKGELPNPDSFMNQKGL